MYYKLKNSYNCRQQVQNVLRLKLSLNFQVTYNILERNLNLKESVIFSITGYLAYSLQLKVGVKVTLTCNIDIQDPFVNVHFGVVKHLSLISIKL